MLQTSNSAAIRKKPAADLAKQIAASTQTLKPRAVAFPANLDTYFNIQANAIQRGITRIRIAHRPQCALGQE